MGFGGKLKAFRAKWGPFTVVLTAQATLIGPLSTDQSGRGASAHLLKLLSPFGRMAHTASTPPQSPQATYGALAHHSCILLADILAGIGRVCTADASVGAGLAGRFEGDGTVERGVDTERSRCAPFVILKRRKAFLNMAPG